MEANYIDNFLPLDEFKKVQDTLMWSTRCPMLLTNVVSGTELTGDSVNIVDKNNNQHLIEEEDTLPNWNYFGVHSVYEFDTPMSDIFQPLRKTFIPKFESMDVFRSLIRARINFFPHTSKVQEHKLHTDFNFNHIAGIFCLNTCNGYTGFENGDKIDSVANRMIFFDGSELHHSTTTSNAPGRWNIAFNFV